MGRDNALEVIRVLSDTDWAILGGDVLMQPREGLYRSDTCDSWTSKPASDETCTEDRFTEPLDEARCEYSRESPDAAFGSTWRSC